MYAVTILNNVDGDAVTHLAFFAELATESVKLQERNSNPRDRARLIRYQAQVLYSIISRYVASSVGFLLTDPVLYLDIMRNPAANPPRW